VEQEEKGEGREHIPARLYPILTVVLVGLYGSGVWFRPDGALWDRVYDVALFNAAYLPAAAGAWRASVRVRAERLAWRSLTVALLLYALGNGLRTMAAGTDGNGPYPPAIDLLALLAYLLLYVAMVGLIRARVPRFHPSMWLDGVIGALGTTAVGVAFLIGPYLDPASGRPAIDLINLALPAMDVLLLALLVAVGSILGLRMDRSLVSVILALFLVLTGDVLLFARVVQGTYVDGGATEVAWLAGIAFAALAAHHARTGPRAPRRATSGRGSAGGCSPCRWPATSPACSCSRPAGATPCRRPPPGWRSPPSSPPSRAPPSPSARSAPSTR
jgi:diguanylate cyclase